ncbi:exodeoxyribonuclease VII large subunit [Variovorax sp. PCZ-1]|uniref:exodeoxyribonuclease VII large subunit n=1 Tax=Variovorax sp. PCZ-1 TaxID=2835533 RepID=UPI001BCED7B0|nr:exodeoxyribonuclease VII large subunit [Variovorax sp. PCZ-1]MBS7808359.1 exodeoxyribonuclease VII large subunit [Variovorax sp. PCZ-1]
MVFEAPGGSRVWAVGALVRAVADALEARFNPVSVKGEITGFSRAASGHCYFSLKDDAGQIRCAMFRRAASLMDFQPKEGDLVELRGRISIYEPRGDLQLIVESLQKAGQGAWFEQFLKLKAQLEAEGLFDTARKREIPRAPRGIGLVTSSGAAALQDVVTALSRRVPHIPVWFAPASVQGNGAPAELIEALQKLYHSAQNPRRLEPDLAYKTPQIDVILLVRGGGSIEDLWAFNNEALARTIAQSPVPIISGVGHETDFTIADFVADLRAPTPTAAAELCATERAAWLGAADLMQERLEDAVQDALDTQAQRVDTAARRLSRPSDVLAKQRLGLQHLAFSLKQKILSFQEHSAQELRRREADFSLKTARFLQLAGERQQRAAQALEHLNPQRVLERGYALVTNEQGQQISRMDQLSLEQSIGLRLKDGHANARIEGLNALSQ